MVRMLFTQVKEAREILEIGPESITIFGVLLAVIAGLIWMIWNLKKEHKAEIVDFREDLKLAQSKLDEEYRRGTEDVKKISENYHVFTVKLFETYKNSMSTVIEKLNTLIGK